MKVEIPPEVLAKLVILATEAKMDVQEYVLVILESWIVDHED